MALEKKDGPALERTAPEPATPTGKCPGFFFAPQEQGGSINGLGDRPAFPPAAPAAPARCPSISISPVLISLPKTRGRSSDRKKNCQLPKNHSCAGRQGETDLAVQNAPQREQDREIHWHRIRHQGCYNTSLTCSASIISKNQSGRASTGCASTTM